MKTKAILEGKLTKLSAALFGLAASPELIANVFQTTQIFAEATAEPAGWVKLVGAAGVICGGLRRAFNYFK